MKNSLKILLILFFLGYNWFAYYRNNLLEVYYLNVGQGDSVLIKTPNKTNILIDGGPDTSILAELGEALPYWVRKIDIIILTHPDLDHLGGLIDLVDRFEIKKVYLNTLKEKSFIFDYFLQKLSDYNIDISSVNSDSDFVVGCCVIFDFVWPQIEADLNRLELNDTSTSLILKYHNFSAFFGGDLGKNFENKLAKDRLIDDVDVLKIGHHGSKNSSDELFLESLKPEVAVISVGEGNKFGHPSPEVLNLLQTNNIKVYRTDELGRIKISTNGNSYFIN